ncbi:MAG: DUF4129 domain-containing protein [Tannerella sp.]|jgi:hypothetical protein|nr:DUF4129 domain-containing protein [Tannerella sp.]
MTFRADTLLYDTQKIADYQADSRFDYSSQLNMPEYTWFDMVSRWFNRLLNSIFSGRMEEKYTTPIMILLFLIVILTVLFFLYKKRPELFMRSKKIRSPLPYDIEEENIHGIDFKKEISAALDSGNYRLAIRLLYLHTLRILSDSQLIDWQIHKTPTEYLYEIKNKDLRLPFRELTNHFLQIRYGNYNASPELYETMLEIREYIKMRITEGGTDER